MASQPNRQRAKPLALMLLGSIFLFACGTISVDTGGDNTGSTVSTPTANRRSAPISTRVATSGDDDGDGILDSADGCPRQRENFNKVFDTDGCPDNGIQELMEVAAEYINDFWAQEFKEGGVRYTLPREVVPYTRQIRTPCGPAVLNNAFYCPRGHGIYYDLNFLQEQLDTDGDFAPATILAHEWGHLVQANLDILGGDVHSIQIELQADCFAGAWAKYAGEQGVLEEGDLDEGAIALFKAGDDINTPWFDPQAHGQPEQRIEAFERGLNGGTDVCFER